MPPTALEEARREPGLLIEIRGTISANVAADLLKAHNKTFRAWCRANGERPRDLVIVDSGTGSYWARLKDVAEVAGLLQLGSDLLPGFMTHLAEIVHLGFASDPSEFGELFTDLLKAYRKAIANKAVKAVVISSLTVKPIEITSVQQVDRLIAVVSVNRSVEASSSPIRPTEAHDMEPRLPLARRGAGFKRHGTVRKLDSTFYVRLDGMDGTLLPAHGWHVVGLQDRLAYAFEGHTLTNDAGETIGYMIDRADPIPQSL